MRGTFLPGCGWRAGRKSELPAKLLPSVEEFQEKLQKLNAVQAAADTLKGGRPEGPRKTLKAAAGLSFAKTPSGRTSG